MLLQRRQFLSSAIKSGGRSWELPRIFFYYLASVERAQLVSQSIMAEELLIIPLTTTCCSALRLRSCKPVPWLDFLQ